MRVVDRAPLERLERGDPVYLHVAQRPVREGEVLHGYNPDAGYIHMLRRAYLNGIAHLETLLHADWMDASITGKARVYEIRLMECVFEVERVERFAARPSRIGGVFLARSMEAADAFNANYRKSATTRGATGTTKGAMKTGTRWGRQAW